MFDGFFPVGGTYRSIFIPAPAGIAVEPTETPTDRIIGPVGVMSGYTDIALSSIDAADGVTSWTPDVILNGLDFTRGQTYHIVVRYQLADDILVEVRSFTVT
jgi:hypothetical protein